ncbi:hypothetical protein D3C73_1141330 [compost metagenome]
MKTLLDETALACENFLGQFTAVLAGHGSLDAFIYSCQWRTVVFEGLCAIHHPDAGAGAEVFVVSTLICVLKTSPTADVIDQNDLELSPSGLNIVKQCAQCIPTANI